MFIGREYEIKALNKLYEKDSFQFVVMYGRRRVGKIRLLTEFCLKTCFYIIYKNDNINYYK